jgi:hypothetical protein
LGPARPRPEEPQSQPRRGAVLLEALPECVGLGLGQPAGLDLGLELIELRAVQGGGELLGRDVQALGDVIHEGLARIRARGLRGRVRATGERHNRDRR